MPFPIEDQIRKNVRKFALGILSLDEFLQWFVPISWDIEKSKNPSLIALVHGLDGILAESSSAKWSESDMREVLAEAVRPFRRSQSRLAEFRPMQTFLLYDLVPGSAVELTSSNVRMRLETSDELPEKFIPHQPPAVPLKLARAI
jgi:hypothetical protein